jgi:hypothetical protein
MVDEIRKRDREEEDGEEPTLEGEEVDETLQPPREMREFLAMFQTFGPRPNPLANKITASHIDKLLDLELRKEDNDNTQDTEDRRARIHLTYIACVFVLALVGLLMWAGQQALIQNVLIALISLVAGAFGGYGYRASKDD